jgi:hypothetical protein
VYAQLIEKDLGGESLPFDSLRMAPEVAMAISDPISCASWFVVFDLERRERI